MNKFQISKMTDRPGAKGTTKRFPVIEESAGFRRSLLGAQRAFLKRAAAEVRRIIIPAYNRRVTVDASESDFERLQRVLANLLDVTNRRVKELLELDAIRHTEQFMDRARKSFGVDLRGIVDSEDLRVMLDAKASQNAALIKGMSDDLVKRVQIATTNSIISGETVGKLQKRFKREFEISDTRAARIARDQTNKLNADLNKFRHTQAGINKYAWLTSADERVRSRHRKINGKIYEYGKPTGAEQGLEPGQPIECRCIGQGIVEF